MPIECVQGQQPTCSFGDTPILNTLVTDAGEVWLAASPVQTDTVVQKSEQFPTVVYRVDLILVIII